MTDIALDRLRSDIAAKVQASGTSFYSAMRMLPAERRNAMYAIYTFCREVDDIADEAAPLEEKRAALEEWRAEIDRLYGGKPLKPVARALMEPVKSYALRKQDFLAVIDGMEMDAEQDIVAPDIATLDLYCDRVASAVGHLSVRAFGANEPEADVVAHHLGRALQLTNILRDIAEDAERGRLYLPRELLEQQGIPYADLKSVLTHPKLRKVCRDVAILALDHFSKARAAMDRCAKGPMRPAAVMGAVYRAILKRLVATDWQQLDKPVKLPKWQKAWLAIRYGLL
ncbi:MAG TPA: presqualene diphosphate synthase HpnD [Candidatus Cybelea sp.]|nr:presqualene diphosphate synthase HpnD [Candidatus Cybelea sp.]